MSTHSINFGTLDKPAHEKLPVSKWIKLLYVATFFQAIVLFFSSFLIFFVKRTQGVDPMMISGSFTGTTQLTFFCSYQYCRSNVCCIRILSLPV